MEKLYIRFKTIKLLKVVIYSIINIEVFFLIYYILERDYVMLLILTGFLAFLFILFGTIYLIERKANLVITNVSITFYYHLFSRDKGYRGLNRRGLEILFRDIKYIGVQMTQGIPLLANPSKKVSFIMKDGSSFSTYFFHFGSESEEEIITILLSKVN